MTKFHAMQVPEPGPTIDIRRGGWLPRPQTLLTPEGSNRYCKMGNLVFISARLRCSSAITNRQISIEGLPFSAADPTGLNVAVTNLVGNMNIWADITSSTVMRLTVSGTLSSGMIIYISGVYETNT
jgi:hypothetical protein